MKRLLTRLYFFILKHAAPLRHARRLGVTVGQNCRLINCSYSTEAYLITLGDHVSATRTHFETHDGGVWVFRIECPEIDLIRPITVGNNVYFGEGAMVMPGITIGDNVIIGARAVVTKDIPSNSVAVGMPAKVIKTVDEYFAKVSNEADMTKLKSGEAKRAFYLNKYG